MHLCAPHAGVGGTKMHPAVAIEAWQELLATYALQEMQPDARTVQYRSEWGPPYSKSSRGVAAGSAGVQR